MAAVPRRGQQQRPAVSLQRLMASSGGATWLALAGVIAAAAAAAPAPPPACRAGPPRQDTGCTASKYAEPHAADADACCTSTNTTGLVHLLVRTVAKVPAARAGAAAARALLGAGQVRAIEGISGRTLPGATLGGLHKDCAQDFHTLPDTGCCWGVVSVHATRRLRGG
jgi:hypothetical protein